MAKIAIIMILITAFIHLEAKSLVPQNNFISIDSNDIPNKIKSETLPENIKPTSIFGSVQNLISPLMHSILSNETIRVVLSDPMIQGVLLNANVQKVLNNPIVQSILTNPEVQGITLLQNIISNLPISSTTSTSVVMSVIPQTTPTPINTSIKPDLYQSPTILRPVLAKPLQKSNFLSVINMVLTGLDEFLKVVQIQMERRTSLRRN